MDKEHIRARLTDEAMLEFPAKLVVELHSKLRRALADQRAAVGREVAVTPLMTADERWLLVEDVHGELDRALSGLGRAIEDAFAFLVARGSCGDPECGVCTTLFDDAPGAGAPVH